MGPTTGGGCDRSYLDQLSWRCTKIGKSVHELFTQYRQVVLGIMPVLYNGLSSPLELPQMIHHHAHGSSNLNTIQFKESTRAGVSVLREKICCVSPLANACNASARKSLPMHVWVH